MEPVKREEVKYWWYVCHECKKRAILREGTRIFRCTCGWKGELVAPGPPPGPYLSVFPGGKTVLKPTLD